MATKPFTATIGDEKLTVYQNVYTGLFYTIANDGRHTPVDYPLIKAWTTSQQRLKYWRNRYGYTQTELAKLVHVSSPTVVMTWENGLKKPLKRHRKLLNAELSHDIYLE